jgi:pimeloyl-ACP methyl ester carboxylesterase
MSDAVMPDPSPDLSYNPPCDPGASNQSEPPVPTDGKAKVTGPPDSTPEVNLDEIAASLRSELDAAAATPGVNPPELTQPAPTPSSVAVLNQANQAECESSPPAQLELSPPPQPTDEDVRHYTWFWQNQPLRITYSVLGQGQPVLLLPAFSSISSRIEMQGLAQLLAVNYQVYVLDWLGFGQSDRSRLEYAPKLYRAFLRSFVQETFSDPVVVIAAGHTAGYVMQLAQETPQPWKWVVLVAPTWRGPLPTMMGEKKRNMFKWLQRLVNTPILGQFLYWMNTTRGFLKWMYQRHVFADPSHITPELIRTKQRCARQPQGRLAAAAFVTGALDPLRSREDWLSLFHPIPLPVLLVIGEQMPPKSREEAEVVAHFGGGVQVLRLPGTLGLHEEYPHLLADRIMPFLHKYLSK